MKIFSSTIKKEFHSICLRKNYIMKIKQLLIGVFAFLLPLIFGACGQSASEKAQLQIIHDDSVKNAVAQALQQKYATKEALKDSIQTLTPQLSAFSNRMELLKANLEVANDEMNKIKEFHFGRTDAEREAEIRDQSLKIQNIEREASELNNKLNQGKTQLAEYNSELEKSNFQP